SWILSRVLSQEVVHGVRRGDYRLRISFQRRTIPFSERRSCFIGGLKKCEQVLLGSVGGSNVIVHQQKFVQLRVVESSFRADGCLTEAGRFRRRVGIERR